MIEVLSTVMEGSWLFSLFAMQTKGACFSRAITFGRAGYVATGRGFQMETISVPPRLARAFPPRAPSR